MHEDNLVQIFNLGALKYIMVKQLWVVSSLEWYKADIGLGFTERWALVKECALLLVKLWISNSSTSDRSVWDTEMPYIKPHKA